jgi:hypothetical protein
MVDQTEYKYFIGSSAPIPKKNPGRGIITINEEPFEFQVPLIFEENNYSKNMTYVLNQLSVYLLKKAPRVPIVPEEINIETIKNNITDLSKVPLGINTNTAQIGYYNFQDLITVISSSSYSTVKKFFKYLIEILSLVRNNKVIVLNALNDCPIEIPSNVKSFDNSFEKVLDVINNNIDKYLNEKKEDNFCILVLGYENLNKEIANSETGSKLEDLILKSKGINNFKYILFDTEDEIQTIDKTDIDSYFKRNNGLWLGKDFDSQNLFELNNIQSDSTLNSTVTIIYNGNVQNIKYN